MIVIGLKILILLELVDYMLEVYLLQIDDEIVGDNFVVQECILFCNKLCQINYLLLFTRA